ncbi:MAG: capsular polysaccharide biosynthesis protein CapF [Bacteroidetes bacterium]|nr:capsular polysaccharide biosynthesis protein CapF [Bacteroidota bacterium]
MKILVTGAKGFVGSNLVAELNNIKEGKDKTFKLDSNVEIFSYDIDTDPALLDNYCKKADFVFNLAGVNRPKDQEDFMKGNFGFATTLLNTLKKHKNNCPVMISSSIQAAIDNPYGKSKKAGEDLMLEYSKETGAKVLIYRFPNIFGKWCRPNYNSAVATFCNNIANGLSIQVNDRKHPMDLVYIDDVLTELIHAAEGNENKLANYCKVPVEYHTTLGEIVDLLYSFKESRETFFVSDMSDGFSKKLYSTYLSYLPLDKFSYPLISHIDNRGSFTEFLKSKDRGQISINVSHPNIIKGEHWHHTKNEKFLVVSGKGVIRFRPMNESTMPTVPEILPSNVKIIGNVIEYYVSGDKLEVIDIPTGYTHNIENLGDNDMVTVMWCNECFNPEKPDTFFEPIKK